VRRLKGSCADLKLTRGARAHLPAFVPGPNLSVGGLQFNQGDGKITGFAAARWKGRPLPPEEVLELREILTVGSHETLVVELG
jgi:hypothetical protein